MIDKIRSYYAINRDVVENRDRVFINNPVVMQGLGLVPIVAVSNTMRDACIMGLAVLLLLTPTRIVAAFLSRSTHFRFRAVAYSVTAALIYAAVSWLIVDVFALPVQAIGLYLPLLVLEPLIIKRYARTGTERMGNATTKGLITTAGFLLVMFMTAACRELLGAGTFFGMRVFDAAPVPYLHFLGGGFIFVGVFIALWRNLVRIFKEGAKKA